MNTRSHRISLFGTLAAAAVAGGFFGLTLTGGGAGGGVAVAAPAPEPDPVPRRWQLTLEPGSLRVMTVDPDADGPETARMYYYLTYKVINNSGQDLLFTPSFDLATDEGDLQRSGRSVPRAVTDQIITALENEFLQDQISIVGMLLQGEENAKEGLAVWPVGSAHVRDLRVFANGFSGETRTLDAYDAETKGTKRVVLRKTLMLRYQPLGETRDMGAEGLPKIEERWVMR